MMVVINTSYAYYCIACYMHSSTAPLIWKTPCLLFLLFSLNRGCVAHAQKLVERELDHMIDSTRLFNFCAH